MKLFFKIILVVLLTLLTQVGGIVYLFSEFFCKSWKVNFRFKSLVFFLAFYLLSTFLIVPTIAPFFGREPVKHLKKVEPTNYMTVLLNRNYVVPDLNLLLTSVSNQLESSNIEIRYLDANFPFLNKFPLLPHLSHNDGKKIDLSLIYETKEGQISNHKKSISGYGVFESPRPYEINQIDECLKSGYKQYDYPKYLTFGSVNKDLIFSEKGTTALIINIAVI